MMIIMGKVILRINAVVVVVVLFSVRIRDNGDKMKSTKH